MSIIGLIDKNSKKMQKLHMMQRALLNDKRLYILGIIEKEKVINVTGLVYETRICQSEISQALKPLYEQRFLGRRKVGKRIYYWINKKRINNFIAISNQVKEEFVN